MGTLSIMHWLVVIAVILLFAGPKRIPDLARALGRGIREFKKAVGDSEPESPNESISQSSSVHLFKQTQTPSKDLIPLNEFESSFHRETKVR